MDGEAEGLIEAEADRLSETLGLGLADSLRLSDTDSPVSAAGVMRSAHVTSICTPSAMKLYRRSPQLVIDPFCPSVRFWVKVEREVVTGTSHVAMGFVPWRRTSVSPGSGAVPVADGLALSLIEGLVEGDTLGEAEGLGLADSETLWLVDGLRLCEAL